MLDRIGIIGLGIMGRPMAHNLLKAGFPLVVHHRHQHITDELLQAGAQATNRPCDIAASCDVVITMLPTASIVEEIATGPDGIIEGAHSGLVVIDMSTISPVITRNLATKLATEQIAMLDAPVSGGDVGAAAGTLSIMVGGDEAIFTRCLPIFEALGQTIVHVGEQGAGQMVKACNQIIVALNLEAIGEALILGSKAGVDPHKLLRALGGGFAASRLLELRGPTMITHNFTPGGRISLHHKDLGIVLEAARTYGVSLPITAMVDQMFASLEARGQGGLDHSALLMYLEELAGYRVGDTHP